MAKTMQTGEALAIQLVTLMKADSDFDDIKVFFIGEPPIIQNGHYPAMTINIGSQAEITQRIADTGPETGTIKFQYPGIITVNQRIPVRYDVKNRVVNMIEDVDVDYYLDKLSNLLESYPRLDNYSYGDEQVRYVTRSNKDYFPPAIDDNLFWTGFINIIIETDKPRGD